MDFLNRTGANDSRHQWVEQPPHLQRCQPFVFLLAVEIGRRADPGPATDVRHRHPVRALLEDERLLSLSKLRCLHRLPLLPAKGSWRGKLQPQMVQVSGTRSPSIGFAGPFDECSERGRLGAHIHDGAATCGATGRHGAPPRSESPQNKVDKGSPRPSDPAGRHVRQPCEPSTRPRNRQRAP